MSAQRNDGGPAFPFQHHYPGSCECGDDHCSRCYERKDGMSLRDYFAAQALITLVGRYEQHPHTFSDLVSEKAYEYADAMLKAREAA